MPEALVSEWRWMLFDYLSPTIGHSSLLPLLGLDSHSGRRLTCSAPPKSRNQVARLCGQMTFMEISRGLCKACLKLPGSKGKDQGPRRAL